MEKENNANNINNETTFISIVPNAQKLYTFKKVIQLVQYWDSLNEN